MHFSSFCADGRPFSEMDLERDEWGFRGLLGQKSNEDNMQLLHPAAKTQHEPSTVDNLFRGWLPGFSPFSRCAASARRLLRPGLEYPAEIFQI